MDGVGRRLCSCGAVASWLRLFGLALSGEKEYGKVEHRTAAGKAGLTCLNTTMGSIAGVVLADSIDSGQMLSTLDEALSAQPLAHTHILM